MKPGPRATATDTRARAGRAFPPRLGLPSAPALDSFCADENHAVLHRDARARPDRSGILDAWIERAVTAPLREALQVDGRIRRWGLIPEREGALSSSGAAGRRRDRPQRVFRSGLYPMKVTFFSDTDTLYIEFMPGSVAETRDLDENTLLDLDATGRICAITVEHATERTGIPTFCYEQVAE